MKDRADFYGLELIPHWKTAQSREIGLWAQEIGIRQITCSSIRQANYLADQGWDNIHIAFPFNIREIESVNKITESQSLSLQIVNLETASFLDAHLTNPVGFMIEIDAGYGRTGVHLSDSKLIESLLNLASKSTKLRFMGFYLHPGHTYYKDDKKKIYEESVDALSSLKSRYSTDFPYLKTRIGDTPGCSVAEEFGDIDQMGPGNFVFYDLMQANLGSCQKSDIAVALAAPVVDVVHDRKEILVHGGGVHLSKDFITDSGGQKIFGEVVLFDETGWRIPSEVSILKSISQEHGLINASQELISNIKVGDLIGILPVHSCMTADCMGSFLSTEGVWIDHAEKKFY
jgi:D-serine deaminase-like pyridoxal phosphate-dependent protein